MQAADVGRDDAILHPDRRVCQRIHKAAALGQAEHRQKARLGEVRVDENHFEILFRGQRQRDIGGGEGLALAGQGRGDQNALRLGALAAGAGIARRLQQVALHDAEFLHQRTGLHFRVDQPVMRELIAVHGAALVREADRRQRSGGHGGRCGNGRAAFRLHHRSIRLRAAIPADLPVDRRREVARNGGRLEPADSEGAFGTLQQRLLLRLAIFGHGNVAMFGHSAPLRPPCRGR